MTAVNLKMVLTVAWIAVTFAALSTPGASRKVCIGKKADIVFVIDESSSIWPVHFGIQRDFLANLTDHFEVGQNLTRFAAVSFASKVTERFKLSDFTTNSEVRQAIEKIDQKTGTTMTDEALKYAREKLLKEARDDVPVITILITDGNSRYPDRTKIQAEALKQTNATVYVVAISNQIKWTEVTMIASEPKDRHIFRVNSFTDLTSTLVEDVANATCNEQKDNPGECTADDKSDVVFVLGSASQNPLGAIQAFSLVQDIISDNNTFVGPEAIQFGLIPKECPINLGFHLNTYASKVDMITHLDLNKKLPTAADHIDSLISSAFIPENGDRPVAKNRAIIIMDRASPDSKSTVAAAERARKAGIDIIAVGVGKQYDDDEITKIASTPTNTHKVTISDYSDSKSLKERIFALICP